MSFYDEHPLPWRAERTEVIPGTYRWGSWRVRDHEGRIVAHRLAESVAKLLAGAHQVVDAAESVLLDADQSDEVPEVSMVSTVSINRLREALEHFDKEQPERRDAS